MLPMHLHSIFLLNIFASFVQGNLTIARYNQLDSNTTCREGLRIGKDTAILKAQANLTNLKTNSTTIKFSSYSKDGESSRHHCLVKTVCDGAKSTLCYCDYIDNNNIMHVVIKVAANALHSEASVRGSYQSQFSEPQRLPKMYIYEMNDYKGQNQICCVDAPSLCAVELVTQHGDVSTGETCVSFNVTQTRYTEDIRLTVKYSVCNVREGELTLQFRSHAITESPEIILNSYEPEDAQPVCKEGLRHEVDKLVFKARAFLTHKSWRVKFIVKRTGEKLFLDTHPV